MGKVVGDIYQKRRKDLASERWLDLGDYQIRISLPLVGYSHIEYTDYGLGLLSAKEIKELEEEYAPKNI